MKLSDVNEYLQDAIEAIVADTPELEEMATPQGQRPSTRGARKGKAATPPESHGQGGMVKTGNKKAGRRYGTKPQDPGHADLPTSDMVGLGPHHYSTPPQSGSAGRFE